MSTAKSSFDVFETNYAGRWAVQKCVVSIVEKAIDPDSSVSAEECAEEILSLLVGLGVISGRTVSGE